MEKKRALSLSAPDIVGRARFPARKLLAAVRRYPTGVIGGVIILTLVVVGVFAPLIAPNSPRQVSFHLLEGPSASYWFGTDQLGRDVLSRVIYGARVSLAVGLASAVGGATLGAVLSLIGVRWRGAMDMGIQRVMDVLMAFPGLILGLGIVAALGPSLMTAIIAIAVPIVPRAARLIRSVALSVEASDYVTAARALGARDLRIMLRHVAPNCTAAYLIVTTMHLGTSILAEASLSFLGLGVPAPQVSWGGMLAGDAARFFMRAPWLAIVPGVAIGTVVLGVNLFGDALRDRWDPKLRQR